MKKLYLIIFMIFLNVILFSCTPESISEDINEVGLCCGDDGNLPPPPPDDD
jgi:hypothetical protein